MKRHTVKKWQWFIHGVDELKMWTGSCWQWKSSMMYKRSNYPLTCFLAPPPLEVKRLTVIQSDYRKYQKEGITWQERWRNLEVGNKLFFLLCKMSHCNIGCSHSILFYEDYQVTTVDICGWCKPRRGLKPIYTGFYKYVMNSTACIFQRPFEYL